MVIAAQVTPDPVGRGRTVIEPGGSHQGKIVVPQEGGTSRSSAQQVEYQVDRPRDILTPVNEVAQEDQRTVVPLRDHFEPGDQPLQLIKLPVQVSDGDDRVVQTRRQGHPEDSDLSMRCGESGRCRQEEIGQPYEAGSIFRGCIVGFFTS